MANDRATISAAIVARLQTVAKLHGRIYDYEPAELVGFPTAVVVGSGHQEIIADNGRDLRVYEYDIRVYAERNKAGWGTEKGERIRRELEDAIFTVFDNYQDLGGTVLWARIRSGGWGMSANNELAYFTLIISAYKSVEISQ